MFVVVVGGKATVMGAAMVGAAMVGMDRLVVTAASSQLGDVPLRVWGGIGEAAIGACVLLWAVTVRVRRPSAVSVENLAYGQAHARARGLSVAVGALGSGVILWGVGEAVPGRPGHIVQLVATALVTLAGLAVAVTYPADHRDRAGGPHPGPTTAPPDSDRVPTAPNTVSTGSAQTSLAPAGN